MRASLYGRGCELGGSWARRLVGVRRQGSQEERRARRPRGQPDGAERGSRRGGLPASWSRSRAPFPAAARTLGHVLVPRGFGGEAAGGEREDLGGAARRGWSCGLGVCGGAGLRGACVPAIVLVWTFPSGPSRLRGQTTDALVAASQAQRVTSPPPQCVWFLTQRRQGDPEKRLPCLWELILSFLC